MNRDTVLQSNSFNNNPLGSSNNNNVKFTNVAPKRRSRRVSSSVLYEVCRKELDDVCYLYVPDLFDPDLVKSHLMFAVREEVEVLKEKISELMERISQLEYENTILKANATPEIIAQIQSKSSQLHGTGGNSNNNTS